MTEETRFQKGVIFVGPKRSGKGTITHVIQRLVGARNYVGLSFDRWTSTENSQAPMIGKRVGVFADVRLKPAKTYGSVGYDAGGLSHLSQGLLLNITGEDWMTIGRKQIGAWEGRLPIKLMLISNEVPNFNDASGALVGRFIKLRFGVSFFGREDVGLKERLDAELTGIAARCVAAYRRLCSRERFVQPSQAWRWIVRCWLRVIHSRLWSSTASNRTLRTGASFQSLRPIVFSKHGAVIVVAWMCTAQCRRINSVSD